jgi:hypothetical protein
MGRDLENTMKNSILKSFFLFDSTSRLLSMPVGHDFQTSPNYGTIGNLVTWNFQWPLPQEYRTRTVWHFSYLEPTILTDFWCYLRFQKRSRWVLYIAFKLRTFWFESPKYAIDCSLFFCSPLHLKCYFIDQSCFHSRTIIVALRTFFFPCGGSRSCGPVHIAGYAFSTLRSSRPSCSSGLHPAPRTFSLRYFF